MIILYGTPGGTLNNSSVSRVGISPAGFASSDFRASCLFSSSGVIKSLRIRLSTAPGVGKSYTFTLVKGSTETDLEVTISGNDTEGSDESNEVSITAGEVAFIRITPSGTPTAASLKHSVGFEPTEEGATPIFAMSGGNNILTGTRYFWIDAVSFIANTTEAPHHVIAPTDGVLKNLFVKLTAAPGAGNSRTFAVRVNGSTTALSVTLTGSATGNDTSDSIAVSAGDRINYISTTSGSPASMNSIFGVTFVPTNKREQPIFGRGAGGFSNSASDYAIGLKQASTSSESDSQILARSGVFKKMFFNSTSTPGSGKSYTYTLRKNGVNTPLEVLLANTNTAANNVDDSASVKNGDLVSLRSTPDGTPTVSDVRWGIVFVHQKSSSNFFAFF